MNEDGDVKGEKPKDTTKGPSKVANWTLLLKNGVTQKKMIYSFDDVLIKSVYGNFLRVEEDGTLNAYSNNIGEKCSWHIQKAKVPF